MLYIVDVESVESRYTYYWKTHIPDLFHKHNIKTRVIEGHANHSAPTKGQFLNFSGTNIYKSQQVEKIAELFEDGLIHRGDQFLFTDAWHPGILNLKYMSELTNIPVKIHGLWHAGNYDENDFLGRIGKKDWIFYTELALFNAIDKNYFATNFHLDMFLKRYKEHLTDLKYEISGWPMEYILSIRKEFCTDCKENLIVFPHRIAPEKQVNVFENIQSLLPQYKFVVCQKQNMTKNEYYETLSKAKIVFSANLQETLGISVYEGLVFGAVPMVPDYLSYKEMYPSTLKYPSEWITKTNNIKYDNLCKKIVDIIENYENYEKYLHPLKENNKFFNANVIIENIKNENIRSN